MTFEEAKKELIANAVGGNEFHKISSWVELEETAEQEQIFAVDRARLLGEVASLARNKCD
ncbi:MAG: hypothetical protein HAW67_01380 [Endozoicomonadaceae bacterium]|nr:hypothetical protein [Endozoicomonadaceae bacterium]